MQGYINARLHEENQIGTSLLLQTLRKRFELAQCDEPPKVEDFIVALVTRALKMASFEPKHREDYYEE